MNYICDTRDTAPALNVVNVKAEEELKAGDVVAINTLVEDEENREVYKATMPTEGDIRYAIIVNQGIEEDQKDNQTSQVLHLKLEQFYTLLLLVII